VDHGRLDHRAEGLIVVDVGSLGEATKDPMSLVLQNPFVSDDIGANGVRDKISGIVGDQGNKFFFHGTTPVRINEGGADGGEHR
jgi:hypothetical protein